ncbi:MAG: DNA polymerase IV [Armatimonadota bacterium]|jgi:DNA polymerase-4
MIEWDPNRRIILHVDFDAFFASVEVRRNPDLRGRPVIVGGTSNRGVVSAASYEAREFGVHSAMPMWQARRRCPHGVFLPVDGTAYAEYSARARVILSRFSPRMDPASIDEAYLDVTGSIRLFGGLGSLLRRIKREIREELGITVSIGCAPNRLVAKMASDWDKPDGLSIVRPDELPERLFELPVGDIPGVGEVTREKLAQMGVRTIGQLARVPAVLLERHFGRHGSYLHRAAHARDESPVPYYEPGDDDRKQISREETLAQDTRDLAVLEQRLLALSEEVARRLRRRGQCARTVTLKVKLSNFRLFTRSHTLDTPTELEDDIFGVAREMLGRVRFGAQQARLIGVGVSNLTEGSGPGQLSLFSDTDERRSELARARDEIAERFGRGAITRARLVHEPEVHDEDAESDVIDDDPLRRL